MPPPKAGTPAWQQASRKPSGPRPVDFASRPERTTPAGRSPPRTPAPKGPGIDPRMLQGPTAILATNAPEHWPRVRAPRSFLKGNVVGYDKKFVQGVRASLEKHGLRVIEEGRRRMSADGVFEIPWIVLDRGREVPVYLLPHVGRDNAARFHGARRMLAAMGAPAPVYFAATRLPDVPAVSPCRPWTPEDLALHGPAPKGTFAMWWSTPKEQEFIGSTVHEAARRAYRALDGQESYLYARVLRALGGKDVTLERAPLPEAQVDVPLRGPDDRVFYLSAGREKGLRLHFDRDGTPAAYRDAMWRHFAAFAAELAAHLDDVRKDAYYEDRPLRWLEALEARMRNTVHEVGVKERLVGGLDIA